MHRIIRIKAYEAEHGPHFNDEHARKAVNKMENEDGTRGQHWSLEETTALANQYGIRLDEKINKYDWYVALNMVYSDYYRAIYVTTDTEANQVTYGLCPYQWRQLPNEGILLLNVQHTPSASTAADAAILIDPTHTTSSVNTVSNVSAGGKQLVNGSGDQMVNQEVTVGNKYFVYYNKCNGIFQVVNHIVTPAAPAPAA